MSTSTTFTTAAISDALPSSVPKLDASGSNWAIFVFRFKDAVEAKGFWSHFDGTASIPTFVDAANPTAAETSAKAQWDKDERSAKSLLTQKLPDSTVVMVHGKVTVRERWEAVVKEFSKKSAYAQADMRAKFMGLRCPDKGNPRDFLEGLRVKKEELAQAGVEVDEKDYFSIIISSLPYSLSNFASSQLAAAQFLSTKKITPDDLLSMLLEESDRQRAQFQRRRVSGKGKEDNNEALSAEGSSKLKKGKGHGHGHKHADVMCWNCEEKGHISRNCKKPKKSKMKDDSGKQGGNGKAGGSGSGNANVAEKVTGDEEEGAWAAEEEELDWFDEVVEAMECEGRKDAMIEDFGDTSGEAFVVAEAVESSGIIAELYDSGCTNHISPYRDRFENFERTSPRSFKAANKEMFSTIGKGDLVIDIPNNDSFTKLRLTDVQYSPNVAYTLVSIGRLDEEGFTATFGHGKCVLHGPDEEKVGEVKRTARKAYKVEHEEGIANVAEETLTLDQLHRRMGHASIQVIRDLVAHGMVTGLRLEYTPTGKPFFCESCVYGKATRKPVPKIREGERATVFGGEIHSDLWGKSPVESRGGKNYMDTYIDDKTRLTNVYFLRTKDEQPDAYKGYEAWAESHMGVRIHILNTDRGGEYTGGEFAAYLKSRGTIQKLSVHDTHQESGVAERRNRTIVERVRALLHASGLPKNLWAEAARHVVWLLNRTTTRAVEGMTPYEAAFGKKPNLKGLREWGERVWVRTEGGNKLGGRVREGRWLGVDEQSKGVRIYWPDTRTITVERNTYYDDSSASDLEGEQGQTMKLVTDEMKADLMPEIPETEDNQGRAQRTRKPSRRVLDLLEGRGTWSDEPTNSLVPPGVQLMAERGANDDELDDWLYVEPDHMEGYAFAAVTAEAEALEPRTLAEAKRGGDWPLWEKAIHEELATLKDAGTWDLEEAPAGANIVGSKWVFRAKKDAAGKTVRYKARLVAQGFSQIPGVDYFDTFAPVARLASIRAVVAFAAAKDLETAQIDIKGAYLNGELNDDERIYMRQPPGYGQGSLVCRLKKTLYGLKQSGRRWYQKLVDIMTKLRFSRSEVDQAVFYRRDLGKNILIIVKVHVDDCSIVASTQPLIDRFKIEIKKHVDITDLGGLHWILGIEVKRIREERKILLSQRSYIDSILRRYGFDDLKPISTPMDPNIRLTSAQSPTTTDDIAKMRDIPYHEAIGSLMYASLGTRPDITFAVQTLSRFATNPGIAHWEAVKRVFRYLKGTRELWLSYGGVAREMEGYADADGSMMEDRKAISGYAFMINGGAVSWSTKKQEIISLSTTESEYVAVTYAAKEALWLRSLIFQLFGTVLPSTTLFSDNQSAIALTKEHQYHARTKHIDVRYHFIRWIVEEGKLRLIYCPTEEMVADTLTKALPSAKVKHFAACLGLVSI
jgi:hypothetical protein